MQNGYLSDGRRLVAGFSAGITEALIIVTPFEVVKIRLQQQKGMAKDSLKYRVLLPIPSCPEHDSFTFPGLQTSQPYGQMGFFCITLSWGCFLLLFSGHRLILAGRLLMGKSRHLLSSILSDNTE